MEKTFLDSLKDDIQVILEASLATLDMLKGDFDTNYSQGKIDVCEALLKRIEEYQVGGL